jgi:hypothetical protein
MKSLDELYSECKSIQQEIKSLLLDHYRFEHSLQKQFNVISTVSNLRSNLSVKQREIRERLTQ